MEIGKLPMAIVGITIAVIVCAVVLIPVVQESTQTHDTFTNNGFYTMDKVDDTSSHVITWDLNTPRKIVIDDTEFALSMPSGSYTLYGSEDVIFRLTIASWRVYLQVLSQSFYENRISQDASPTNGIVEISINDGTVTYTYSVDSTEKTFDVSDDSFVINPVGTGEYTMKNSSESAYVLDDSFVILAGSTGTTASNTFAIFSTGSLENGMSVVSNVYLGSDFTTAEYTEPQPTYQVVDGYISLNLLDKYEFTATFDDGLESESTENVTYSYFIVPTSVSAEKSVHADQTTIQLLNVIPLLVIIGIVMLAVGTMIYYRR